MPASCPVASVKAPAVAEAPRTATPFPPLRPKTIAIVAISAGILATAMVYLHLHYKKKKESANREVYENKVINPARVKKRSRRQVRGQGRNDRSSSSVASK